MTAYRDLVAGTPTFAEIEEAMFRVGASRRADGSVRGRCTAHGGSNLSSLVLRLGSSGVPLLHCFARQCAWHEILSSLGLDSARRGRPSRWQRPQASTATRTLSRMDREMAELQVFLAILRREKRNELLDASDMGERATLLNLVRSLERAVDEIGGSSLDQKRRRYVLRVLGVQL